VHGGVSGGGASNERQSYVTRAETESTMKAAAETVDV
jgi:hypothetical protein